MNKVKLPQIVIIKNPSLKIIINSPINKNKNNLKKNNNEKVKDSLSRNYNKIFENQISRAIKIN